MKIVEVNAVNYGSTGKIMYSLSDILLRKGHQVICATGFTWHKTNNKYDIKIGNIVTKSFHMVMSKLFGNHGCYSHVSTMIFLNKIKKFSPDIIHLHNIHGWYLNLKMLTDYIKKNDIKVVYTLHDCWSFTGGCAHFTYCNCNRWKSGCGFCNNLNEYPISSKSDRTKAMFKHKYSCLSDISNLTIVTPSEWLASLVKESFLKDSSVKVINNGIDLTVFKPTVSDFKEKHNIADKNMLLGVSFGWSERKGLDVFVKLSKELPNDYVIVLVGTDDDIDAQLPDNIISIHRTHDQQELAKIYSSADVFINPTREDNYPTVNMESIACGTPVVTFRTGGSPEIIDETCGVVVDFNDYQSLKDEVVRICTDIPYSKEQCEKKSLNFNMEERFKEYIDLYESIINN